MKRLSGLMALAAFLAFGMISPLSFAGDEKKKDEEKGGHVVVFGDEKKKDEEKGGHVVVFGDEEKKEEKKGGH